MPEALKVSVDNGRLVIISDSTRDIEVYTIAGISYPLHVEVGYNAYDLPAGIYLVGGTKLMIK